MLQCNARPSQSRTEKCLAESFQSCAPPFVPKLWRVAVNYYRSSRAQNMEFWKALTRASSSFSICRLMVYYSICHVTSGKTNFSCFQSAKWKKKKKFSVNWNILWLLKTEYSDTQTHQHLQHLLKGLGGAHFLITISVCVCV